jgi:hypothetical protein
MKPATAKVSRPSKLVALISNSTGMDFALVKRIAKPRAQIQQARVTISGLMPARTISKALNTSTSTATMKPAMMPSGRLSFAGARPRVNSAVFCSSRVASAKKLGLIVLKITMRTRSATNRP